MRIQYNGKSKILIRLTELVNQKADAEDMEQTAADLQKEIDEKADKSAIPTVGDGVLSVQCNGKSVGTFSANAAENVSVKIPVPEKVSELENDAGYGTYTKPTDGIPKSDLASGVQASLGKADTALQKHQDISGKLDKTGDASNTTVAFSAASARENVKTGEKLSVILGKIAKWFADLKTVAFTGSYNDLANKPTIPDVSGKQDKLTAGTNITISGSTISAKDTTYSDATQSTHGLMTAADKKKLDGMDLSKYLPKSGGVMTGDIDLASNGVDLLVGSQRATQETYATAVAGATISTKQTFSSGLPERKSLVGSFLDQNSVWHSIISVRHRNGYTDGVNYGMYLRSLLTSDSSLIWNKQTGAGKWQGERVLLDSTNYSTYAAKSDHTHDAITNSSLWASGANNAAQWVRLGTVVSSGNFATTVISVWSGDGASGNASQNSWFDIHIKDGWQSTESATKACGVTVYRTRCGTVKVKVIPTAHNTYTVWVYLPWTYWNGNYSVHGKYSSWTPQVLNQAAEPDGTAADIAYYDQAFLTSTVAAANTLTDSGWVATTRNTSFTATSTVKCRKYGQLVEVRGEVTFSNTYGSPTVCTLPAGYRPATVVQACGITPSGKQYMIKADTSGVISFGSDSGSTFVKGTTYRVDLTYLLG